MSLLTPEIRALLGTEKRYAAPEELGRAAIRYFATAVGDDNPLYTDDDYARAHGYPAVVAPPTLICETNQYAGVPRGGTGYAGHEWDIDVPGAQQVRGGNAYVFHRPLLPTDVVTAVWRIADVAERTNSRGHEMLIITSVAEYRGAADDLIASNTESLIWVRRL